MDYSTTTKFVYNIVFDVVADRAEIYPVAEAACAQVQVLNVPQRGTTRTRPGT